MQGLARLHIQAIVSWGLTALETNDREQVKARHPRQF